MLDEARTVLSWEGWAKSLQQAEGPQRLVAA
jgi:hypothetical protein